MDVSEGVCNYREIKDEALVIKCSNAIRRGSLDKNQIQLKASKEVGVRPLGNNSAFITTPRFFLPSFPSTLPFSLYHSFLLIFSCPSLPLKSTNLLIPFPCLPSSYSSLSFPSPSPSSHTLPLHSSRSK